MTELKSSPDFSRCIIEESTLTIFVFLQFPHSQIALSTYYKIYQKVHKKKQNLKSLDLVAVVQFSEGDSWLLRNYWRGKGDYSKFELFEPTHSAGQKEQGRIIFVHSWIYLDYVDWRALKMLPWFPVGRQDHPNTINSQIHLINPQITLKKAAVGLPDIHGAKYKAQNPNRAKGIW